MTYLLISNVSLNEQPTSLGALLLPLHSAFFFWASLSFLLLFPFSLIFASSVTHPYHSFIQVSTAIGETDGEEAKGATPCSFETPV